MRVVVAGARLAPSSCAAVVRASSPPRYQQGGSAVVSATGSTSEVLRGVETGADATAMSPRYQQGGSAVVSATGSTSEVLRGVETGADATAMSPRYQQGGSAVVSATGSTSEVLRGVETGADATAMSPRYQQGGSAVVSATGSTSEVLRGVETGADATAMSPRYQQGGSAVVSATGSTSEVLRGVETGADATAMSPRFRHRVFRAVIVSVLLSSSCATAEGATAVSAPSVPTSALHVELTLLADDNGGVGGLSLRYCARAGSAWPRRLAPENARALPFLVAATDDASARALVVDGDGVRTDGLGAGCARLVIDVARMADTIADRDLALRAGTDLVVTPDLWLWHAQPSAVGDSLILERTGDRALSALLPWDVDADGSSVVDAATFALKSDAAFGRFAVDEVDAAGARFFVARLDGGHAPPHLQAWLSASANAVGAVLGTYPFRRVNVIVVPTQELRPIVVGFFSRGGGPTATFFVGDGPDDVKDDDLAGTGRWVLTHELSHPLLPPVKLEDAWLNEGLATWHQDLLARRAGLLVDDQAYWQELLRGLDTGAARAAEDKLSLDDASAHMHESGAYQHAYWAGVAVMFLAEVEAQKSGASLDDLVRALRARFPTDDKQRSAAELIATVAAGTPGKGADAARALARVFAAHRSEPFPPVDETLAALGVVRAGAAVRLDDTAPLAAIRRAITRTRLAP